MPVQHQFICPLPGGLHARPASLLEELARNFDSAITFANQRTGREANGKSVLSLISADIRHNDPCLLIISGPDEKEALAKMTGFLGKAFLHCDDAPAMPKLNSQQRHLPPGLSDARATYHGGTSVVPGVACGHIVHIGGFKLPATL